MMDDNVYNLMEQLVQESQSLYRIKKNYKMDSSDCGNCKQFWEKLEKDKEAHINELEKLLLEHMS